MCQIQYTPKAEILTLDKKPNTKLVLHMSLTTWEFHCDIFSPFDLMPITVCAHVSPLHRTSLPYERMKHRHIHWLASDEMLKRYHDETPRGDQWHFYNGKNYQWILIGSNLSWGHWKYSIYHSCDRIFIITPFSKWSLNCRKALNHSRVWIMQYLSWLREV